MALKCRSVARIRFGSHSGWAFVKWNGRNNSALEVIDFFVFLEFLEGGKNSDEFVFLSLAFLRYPLSPLKPY